MRRRLFTILSAGSLLVCIGVIVLWILSYGRNHELVRLSQDPRYYVVRTANGWISFFHVSPSLMQALPTTLPTEAMRIARTQNAVRILTVPHWAVMGLLLIGPGTQLWMHHRRRREVFRRTHGRCVQCGYDLRASIERCPECSTPIPERRTSLDRRTSQMRYREDDDTARTEPCPYCGESISELAEVCPHCHSYISLEDAPSHKPVWLIVGVVVCLGIILLFWVI